MTKRVGIFSGTFDPVHQGHVAFAQQALRSCQLDKVFFLVEPRPRRKQGVRAFEHRQHMVQLAIHHEKSLGSIVLEQDRFTAHKTLPLLHARFKGSELYMLMGDDMLQHLGEWPHVDELLSDVEFIIGVRRQNEENVLKKFQTLEETRGLKLGYKIFQAPESSYASQKIRLALKKGHEPEGLSKQVRSYISEHGLYASESATSK